MMLRTKSCLLAAAAALAMPFAAGAQAPAEDGSASWLPFTTSGYVGAGVGQSNFRGDCTAVFQCDDHDTAFRVYTGGRIQSIIGLEVAYVDWGGVTRNDGSERAHGANASLVLAAPLGKYFSVFARGGTTYAWTHTRSDLPFVATGSESGFGLAYGAGAELNASPHWSFRGDWGRDRLRFAGDERRDVDVWTAGVSYRF